ncbi:MAG: D-2-hydroxyacid dehydrogenase [Deltaproteobacteria bacterium]|nr:D-2-hydroxyacid dehydrogenase [Deltaproteobacteria bacterium]
MKIVVLDGYTLNPGDISWDNLKKLGETVIYDRTPAGLTRERSRGADILFTNKTLLGEDLFTDLPELKYIGVLATGYNVVDVEAAKKRNIPVTNIPTYGTSSVAQMTFAILLELCNHVHDHSSAVHRGDWVKCIDWCFWNHPLIELADKTMGIIGFGRIGQRVADIATALGMNVLGFDAYKSDQSLRRNFRWAELDELLRESDVVSLHCPLFPATQGIINKDNLSKMKRTAFLINTSRGPLVVDEDLTEALNKGIIAGAGLDVLSVEPPQADNPLLGAKNCVITPHIAWATKEARARLMDVAVDNLKAFLAGNPVNVVNK